MARTLSSDPYQGHADLLVRSRVCLTPAEDREERRRPQLNSAAKVAAFVQHLTQADQEVAVVIPLNAKSRPLGIFEVAIGGTRGVNVEMQHLLKVPILQGALKAVIVHNHPSGDRSPSESDRRFFRRAAAAFDLVGVRLVDSLVVARDGFYSLRWGRGDPWSHGLGPNWDTYPIPTRPTPERRRNGSRSLTPLQLDALRQIAAVSPRWLYFVGSIKPSVAQSLQKMGLVDIVSHQKAGAHMRGMYGHSAGRWASDSVQAAHIRVEGLELLRDINAARDRLRVSPASAHVWLRRAMTSVGGDMPPGAAPVDVAEAESALLGCGSHGCVYRAADGGAVKVSRHEEDGLTEADLKQFIDVSGWRWPRGFAAIRACAVLEPTVESPRLSIVWREDAADLPIDKIPVSLFGRYGDLTRNLLTAFSGRHEPAPELIERWSPDALRAQCERIDDALIELRRKAAWAPLADGLRDMLAHGIVLRIQVPEDVGLAHRGDGRIRVLRDWGTWALLPTASRRPNPGGRSPEPGRFAILSGEIARRYRRQGIRGDEQVTIGRASRRRR